MCSKIERAVSDICGDRKKSWNVHHISELETHIVCFPELLQVTYQQIAPVLIIGTLPVSATTCSRIQGAITFKDIYS